MKELEAICRKVDRLEGDALAVESLLVSMCEVLPQGALPVVRAFFASEIEAVRQKLQNFAATRSTAEAFDVSAQRLAGRLGRIGD